MKFVINNYRAVILCESVMMCSALAASIFAQPDNYKNCSLEYLRNIMEFSCENNERDKRQINEISSNLQGSQERVSHRFRLPFIPKHMLPSNTILRVKRKRRKLIKRSVFPRQLLLEICCKNMAICEDFHCLPFE